MHNSISICRRLKAAGGSFVSPDGRPTAIDGSRIAAGGKPIARHGRPNATPGSSAAPDGRPAAGII